MVASAGMVSVDADLGSGFFEEDDTMEMDEIARQDDERTEATQTAIFDACAHIRGLANDGDVVSPAAAIEMVRLAVFMLNKVEEVDGIQEVIHPEDIDLKASVWGQLLMTNTEERMSIDHKAWLIAVAEHMGPDWLEWLRRDVAFMIKVESF